MHLTTERNNDRHYTVIVKSDSMALDMFKMDISTFDKKFSGTMGETVNVSCRIHLHSFEGKINLEDIRTAIYQEFDRDCTCSHDCCGCWWGGVTKIEYDGEFYWVSVVYNKNV